MDAPPPDRGRRPRPAPPSPEEIAAILADRAFAMAPEPQLGMAPGRVGLTGLDSFFWLVNELEPIAATANAGPVTVTAEARPVQYHWYFGDGSDMVTSHSGRAWSRRQDGNISHMYETKGAYDLTVDVIWDARWRVGAGEWQHLGYFSNADEARYPVREMIAFLVRGD